MKINYCKVLYIYYVNAYAVFPPFFISDIVLSLLISFISIPTIIAPSDAYFNANSRPIPWPVPVI